jgi:hypothetical protein
MRRRVLGGERNRPLELPDRVVQLSAVLIEEPEIVMGLSALVVLLEDRAILRDRVLVVADPLIVERQTEMILRRRRRRLDGRDGRLRRGR